MRDYKPRFFYKGGASSGGGKSTESVAKLDEEIKDLASAWYEMGEEQDLGLWVDEFVTEMQDFITAVTSDFDAGLNEGVYSFDKNSHHEYQLYKQINGYLTNTNDYENVHIAQTLDLHSITVNRQGLINFLKYSKNTGYVKSDKTLKYAREIRANTRTALVRTSEGNLRTLQQKDYKSNSDFASELRRNGYKVLKVWKGKKTRQETDNWYFMNRAK